MIIGALRLHIYLPESQSLKDKRQVLQSYKEKLRRKFQVSVCELEKQDSWRESILGVAYINSSRVQVEKVLDNVISFGDMVKNLEVLNFEKEIL
ncbi:MAG: DUF503 domain-containing protein [Caldiserica bacterium]|nr:DUF503 domain-containing protein [Caldisericota bacterium]